SRMLSLAILFMSISTIQFQIYQCRIRSFRLPAPCRLTTTGPVINACAAVRISLLQCWSIAAYPQSYEGLAAFGKKTHPIFPHPIHLPPPLPQLFPHLDQRLHLSRAGQPAVDEPAILERPFVKIPYSAGA